MSELDEGMTNQTLKLSGQEARILRDICFARMKVLKAGDPETPKDLPKQNELNEMVARQCLIVFDFFSCAMMGNERSVRIQAEKQHEMGPHAGGEYYDGMIADYQSIMGGLMQGYGMKEVLQLQNRLKTFIREAKKPMPRTLYIADNHFYHDRICREMDCRGFTGFEEMNAYIFIR